MINQISLKIEEKGRRKMYQKQGPSKGATTTLLLSLNLWSDDISKTQW